MRAEKARNAYIVWSFRDTWPTVVALFNERRPIAGNLPIAIFANATRGQYSRAAMRQQRKVTQTLHTIVPFMTNYIPEVTLLNLVGRVYHTTTSPQELAAEYESRGIVARTQDFLQRKIGYYNQQTATTFRRAGLVEREIRRVGLVECQTNIADQFADHGNKYWYDTAEE